MVDIRVGNYKQFKQLKNMSNNQFLPEGYNAPSTANSFMKFEDGDSTFRVLSPAVVGWEFWTNDNKVVRSKEIPTETPNIKLDKKGNPTKPKHFWAFVVWNYDTSSVQVLHIAQKSVQTDILNLVNDADWGNPMDYDIKVNRSGKELLTKYQVSPKPKKPITEEMAEEFTSSAFDIEDMYFGNKEVQPFD